MIFIADESKKIVNLFLNNNYKEKEESTHTFYTLNNKFVLNTPTKTIIFGKTRLELEKNIFKNLQKIVEIKDTQYRLKANLAECEKECMVDNETNIKFAYVISPERIVNVGHIKISNVFKGTYVWCKKNDVMYLTSFVLPHFKSHKIYENNNFEEFLLELVKENMKKH
ncbi:hypothetical protein BDAP_002813 [Binucleata daphniae]